jgi:hypothetical protein
MVKEQTFSQMEICIQESIKRESLMGKGSTPGKMDPSI